MSQFDLEKDTLEQSIGTLRHAFKTSANCPMGTPLRLKGMRYLCASPTAAVFTTSDVGTSDKIAFAHAATVAAAYGYHALFLYKSA
jgi:hypothetical protein